MTLTDSQKAEVKTTMETYAAAYKNKDILGLLAVFSPEICGFGSGPDEVVTGRDSFARQVQRDMSQATVNGVVFTDTQIFGDGRVAWLMTKSAISFSLPGEKMQTVSGPVHHGDEKHREPVADRADPFLPALWRASRRASRSRVRERSRHVFPSRISYLFLPDDTYLIR